jgi:hypothetical protein
MTFRLQSSPFDAFGGLLFWEAGTMQEWLAFAGVAAALWTGIILIYLVMRWRSRMD